MPISQRAADGSIQTFPDDTSPDAIRLAMLAHNDPDTWGGLAGKVASAIGQVGSAPGGRVPSPGGTAGVQANINWPYYSALVAMGQPSLAVGPAAPQGPAPTSQFGQPMPAAAPDAPMLGRLLVEAPRLPDAPMTSAGADSWGQMPGAIAHGLETAVHAGQDYLNRQKPANDLLIGDFGHPLNQLLNPLFPAKVGLDTANVVFGQPLGAAIDHFLPSLKETQPDVIDLSGKLNAFPNTMLGAVGALGSGIAGLATGTHPFWRIGNNALQLIDAPTIGGRPYTLGNIQVYPPRAEPWLNGPSYQQPPVNVNRGFHEENHTLDQQKDGPESLLYWIMNGEPVNSNRKEQDADLYYLKKMQGGQ